MNNSVFQEIVSSRWFILVLVIALALIAAGIVLHVIASGFVLVDAFSKGVYDFTVLIFLYWVVFMFQVEYGAGGASGFLTNLPLPEYFPNPLDAAALAAKGAGIAFLAELGRIWFLSLQIELFTRVILDIFPPRGFLQHYVRQAIVVIITVILNTALLYYLGQLLESRTIDWIFAVLVIAAAAALVVMGVLAFLFPLAGWLGSELLEAILVPTFATAVAMILAFIAISTDLLQNVSEMITRFTETDLMIYCGLVLLTFFFWFLLFRLLRKK